MAALKVEAFEQCCWADVWEVDYLRVIFLCCGVIGQNVFSLKEKIKFSLQQICLGLKGTQWFLTIGQAKVKSQVTPTEEMQQPLPWTSSHVEVFNFQGSWTFKQHMDKFVVLQ